MARLATSSVSSASLPPAMGIQGAPLASHASDEDRFRYHLSLELRRHGIEPTPALVETALRTHFSSLARNSASAGVPVIEKATESSAQRAPANTSPTSPPSSFLADSKLRPQQQQQPDQSFLTSSKSVASPFSFDVDLSKPWEIDPSSPRFGFGFDAAQSSYGGPEPPPYQFTNPIAIKSEDGSLQDGKPTAFSVTNLVRQPMTSVPSTRPYAASSVDPTSIDPQLVQMSITDQINLQFQLLHELQAQTAASRALPDQAPGSPLTTPATPSVTTLQRHPAAQVALAFDPIPPPQGRDASPGTSSAKDRKRGVPASMATLSSSDRLSPEEYRALSSKEKRQLRNKISARNFRERRKEYITNLEDVVAQRDAVIDTLKSKNVSLSAENERLKALLERHNLTNLPAHQTLDAPTLVASPKVGSAPVQQPPVFTPMPIIKGQYDLTRILELLQRAQGTSSSVGLSDSPRVLCRPSSIQSPAEEGTPTLNLTALNIPIASSGPSSPLSLNGSASPRWAEPIVNTKKDIAYPSSPRPLSRTQSFVAGRPGSQGSFTASITQVCSMFVPSRPVEPFEDSKQDVMSQLARSFDQQVARTRQHTTEGRSHALARSAAACAAAECIFDADGDEDGLYARADSLPSYAQALRSPIL